jgi:hypothetical protein
VAAVAFKKSLRFIPFSINPPFKNEIGCFQKIEVYLYERRFNLKRPQRDVKKPLGAFAGDPFGKSLS